MRHLVDLDEAALDAARQRFGTRTLKDTVNAALRLAAGCDGVGESLDKLAQVEFVDRADAWHGVVGAASAQADDDGRSGLPHWMDEPVEEQWTDEQIGAFLRMQGHSVKNSSVRAWRAGHGIRAATRSSAEMVRQAEASMKGRGRPRKATT